MKQGCFSLRNPQDLRTEKQGDCPKSKAQKVSNGVGVDEVGAKDLCLFCVFSDSSARYSGRSKHAPNCGCRFMSLSPPFPKGELARSQYQKTACFSGSPTISKESPA